MKAIVVPSGDQAGKRFTPWLVSWRAFDPSAPTAQTSRTPVPRSLTKAMVLPSGDHAGSESNAGSPAITWSPEPSAFITWMSKLPFAFERYAILEPWGDQVGYRS